MDEGNREHAVGINEGISGQFGIQSGEKVGGGGWEAEITKNSSSLVYLEYDNYKRVRTTLNVNVSPQEFKNRVEAYFENEDIAYQDAQMNKKEEIIVRSQNGRLRFTYRPVASMQEGVTPQVRIDLYDRQLPKEIDNREEVLKRKFLPLSTVTKDIGRDVPDLLIENLYTRLIGAIMDN